MKKSTKIILIISIISILSFIMIIPSFAVNNNETIEFAAGEYIEFKDIITWANFSDTDWHWDFKRLNDDNVYNQLYTNDGQEYLYYYSNNASVRKRAYNYTDNTWVDAESKVIYFINDTVIDDPVIVQWLKNNVNKTYSDTKNFLTASLGYLHTITNYIISNTVLTVILIGLALVSIAVSLIARLNRKKFK